MKRKIRIIVFLMCIALICIIGFQVYWISETYKFNQQQLGRDVKRVLTVASEQYLGQKAITFFTSLNAEGSVIDKVVVKPYLWNNRDTVRISSNAFSTGKITSTFEIKTDSLFIESKNQFPSHIKVDSNNINVIYDAKNNGVFSKAFPQRDHQSKNFSISTLIEQDSINMVSISTSKTLESLIQKNTDNNSGKSLNYLVIPTLEYQAIDSILRNEFEQLAINLPYEYGVLDNNTKNLIYTSDSLLKTEIQNTQYSATLVQPFSSTDLSLQLYLKNPNGIILKKMLIPLLASFFLIGITIISLGYSLRTILGQKRLSEIKNDFINNMTHEFKTPISTISLALEAIVNFDVQKDADKMDKYLEISRHQTHRLGMMVEKVLRIATSEKTDIKLNLEKIDVHELIEKVKESIEVQVKEKGGEVSITCNAPKAELQADPVHLSNVLYNLIDNANKYSPEKPKITISTELKDEYLKIDVTDNGIGIPKQHRKQIFDKFYRVPTGNIHNVKGFGLGLCYVAMIVNRHEGKVELQSEVDKGSTFSIMLPYQN